MASVNYKVEPWGPCVMRFNMGINELDWFKDRVKDEKDGHLEKETAEDVLKYAWKYLEAYVRVSQENWYDNIPQPELDLVLDNYHLESMWISRQKKMDINSFHSHTGHTSFIIFTDVPEAIIDEQNKTMQNDLKHLPGSLHFKYGMSPMPEHPEAPITTQKFSPKSGSIYVFPSYVEHYVLPFTADATMTKISGTIRHYNENGNPVFATKNRFKIEDDI